MNPKVWAAAVVLLSVAASQVEAAPRASFTARPVQGSICVAPCAVHFDAIGNGTNETTDPVYTREFHSLIYLWNFGDPNSGSWSTGAAREAGVASPKNVDRGAIAGHVYNTAGDYTITLTVTNPAGESTSTTRNVRVLDPMAHFGAANTFCFANSDGNWSGCPLNCAGADAERCTVTNSFQTAMSSGANCAGNDDCADADAQRRWVLFRRGDRFSGGGVTLSASSTAPALISAFGSGAKPAIDGGLQMNTGWTAADLDVDQIANGGWTGRSGHNNVTFYRIAINAGGASATTWAASATTRSTRTCSRSWRPPA